MTAPVSGLRFGPIPANAVHLCIDMQRLFAEDTDWNTPWMERVTPVVERICAKHAERTCFTRFIPAARPGEGQGTWRRYYERWSSMTVEALGPDMIDLVPALKVFTPPARMLDKPYYSPWVETSLQASLQQDGVDTLIVTGGETDVCVLAAVLGAVDLGYRTLVVTDALCSSSDETHDASMALYERRFGQQVETIEAAALLDAWAG